MATTNYNRKSSERDIKASAFLPDFRHAIAARFRKNEPSTFLGSGVISDKITGNISRLGVRRSFSNSERSRRRWNAGELVIRRTLSEGNFSTVTGRYHNRPGRTPDWRELGEKIHLRVVSRNRDVDLRKDLVDLKQEPLVVVAQPVEAKIVQQVVPKVPKAQEKRATLSSTEPTWVEVSPGSWVPGCTACGKAVIQRPSKVLSSGMCSACQKPAPKASSWKTSFKREHDNLAPTAPVGRWSLDSLTTTTVLHRFGSTSRTRGARKSNRGRSNPPA